MSNLVSRVLTSIVLLPIVIIAFILAGVYLQLLLALVGVLCSLEVATIIHPGNRAARVLAVVACLALFVPLTIDVGLALAAVPFVLLCFNGYVLFSARVETKDFEKLSSIFFWCLYVTLAMLCLYGLSTPLSFSARTGLSFVLLACLATWGNDTCAYFGGRLCGKHPLFHRVSAKKTWEGFVSGTIFSVAGVFLLRYCCGLAGIDLFMGLTIVDLCWILLPACILAPVGDLIESRLKRLYNTKDSSNLLPGHGGLLDRIDGLLLTVPWTAFYAFILRPLW